MNRISSPFALALLAAASHAITLGFDETGSALERPSALNLAQAGSLMESVLANQNQNNEASSNECCGGANSVDVAIAFGADVKRRPRQVAAAPSQDPIVEGQLAEGIVLSDATLVGGQPWSTVKATALQPGYLQSVAFTDLSPRDQALVQALIA